MPLLQLKGVTVAFGGPPVLDDLDLAVAQRERLCLLGRNGAGKTTLLRIIQGELQPDEGEIIRSSGLRVASLDQHVPADLSGTVLDVVTQAGQLASPDPASLRNARKAISRVGLSAEASVHDLSAGLLRRALLARALAVDPDVLLLDEPTNHLDLDSIAWLEEFLRRQRMTLIFVTHDRAFLRGLATGVLDLDRGRLTRWDADYDAYLERKRHALELESRADALFDKRLGQEETWIRRGVRERRKRNQGRVRRLMEMRARRSARRDLAGTVRIEAQAAAPTGRLVLQATGISYTWHDTPIVRDLRTTVLRGDRVGIVGPNGSGKTTLLRLLLGEVEPQRGEIRRGVNLEIAYFDQLNAVLDDDATAAENVSGGGPTVTVNGKVRQVVGYLRDFLFTADQARSPIRRFSGGERNRLLLARLFARPSNVLVLDEPTNDLDVETLEVLEGLLAEYEGTVLLVSHDRDLLDHVVTSTLALEGQGRVREYVGGYSDWIRQRAGEAEAAVPKTKKRERPVKPKQASTLDRAERKELNDLPARIEALEAEQAALHERMSDPAFYAQDRATIERAQTRLRQLAEEIAPAYARWEALEAKRTSGA